MSEGFDIQVAFVFDREQSYIEIRARFEKEDTAMSSSQYQQMNVKFYADSLENPKYLSCTKVEKPEDLSSGLMTIPKALKYWKRGELWVLNLEYLKENIVPEGIYDRLRFTDTSKLQCVETLRQLFKGTEVKLFIRLTSDTFAQTLAQLKIKMRDELLHPPFKSIYPRLEDTRE